MSSQSDTMTLAEVAARMKFDTNHIQNFANWGEIETDDDNRISETQLEAFERAIAYHEAGHALVARSFDWTVFKITIHGDGLSGPSCPMGPPKYFDPNFEGSGTSKMTFRINVAKCFEMQAIIAAAGREAQNIGTNRYPNDRVLDGDVDTIMKYAHLHSELNGINGLHVLKARGDEARELLETHGTNLETLVSRLLKDKTIRNEIECEFQGL